MSKKVEKLRDHAGNVVDVRSNGRLRVSMDFDGDVSLTEQSHIANTDIRTLVDRFVQSGQPAPIDQAMFNDFTEMPSYQECLNMVNQVEDLFNNLPLNVRSAYDQNPAAFMAAIDDPTQRNRLVELGVFEAPVELKKEVPQEPTSSA